MLKIFIEFIMYICHANLLVFMHEGNYKIGKIKGSGHHIF